MDNLPEETSEASTTIEPTPEDTTKSTEKSTANIAEEDIILVPSLESDLLLLEPIEMDDSFEGAESALVFRPIFTYRSQQIRRRRRLGRSAESTRSRRSADLDDIDTAESSIVFRPLFRYRYSQQRRAARRGRN